MKMIVKYLLLVGVCHVALCHKLGSKGIALIDSFQDDCDYEGGLLHGKLLGGHKLGHGHGLLGLGHAHGHGHGHGHGLKGHGGLKGLAGHKSLGLGVKASCGSGHDFALLEKHGSVVGVKPPVVIVEEEACGCGVVVEAAPVTVLREAASAKLVGDSKPVRLVHHAEPFLIESHEKPLIIDHYKQAIVNNHNPEPVILDHLLEPKVSIGHGHSFSAPDVATFGYGHVAHAPCAQLGCPGCSGSSYSQKCC